MGRHLATLKADLGGQARSAFQALAALKLGGTAASPAPAAVAPAPGGARRVEKAAAPTTPPPPPAAPVAHTAWTYGALPELMEIQKPNSPAGQVLIGFPALIDKGTHVEIEVFDEPDIAAFKHRAGLRRMVALALKEPLKYLEKNIPDLQKMSVQFISLGSADELREIIIGLAIDRAFLVDPLPTEPVAFKRRLDEGRARLTLIANEVARTSLAILVDHSAAQRKLKDSRVPKDMSDDIEAQLTRLVNKRFLVLTPWAQLAHLPRYLKGVVMRLDKWRADPVRDAARLAELRPIEQRYLRLVAERKGVRDARLDEFRWLLEELRISLFAQELRTPQPVSAKRLEKVWAQMTH
jgi:ATP-dependent helicase HrpA